MVRIVLTRHGHVEGIDPPRFRGRMELTLTREGRAQVALTAPAVAARWKPVAVYTSPMGRCREAGGAIAAACGLGSCETLEDLNDLDYGAWQWRTHDEARAEAPALFDAWRAAPQFVRFPGGESLQDVVARTGDVLRLMMARHAGETVVLVGHDSVNRALLLQVLNQPLSAFWSLSQDPCALTEVDLESYRAHVLGVNETAHLAGLGA